MGAQLSAHMANAGIPVVLFDLTQEGDPNKLANGALKMIQAHLRLLMVLKLKTCMQAPTIKELLIHWDVPLNYSLFLLSSRIHC